VAIAASAEKIPVSARARMVGKIEDLRESEEYFKQALAANAKYADAQARLAEIRLFLRGRSPYPLLEISVALDEANRAVQLDPASAEAHEALATVRAFSLWDWSRAEREFQLALRLNPESGSAHNGYAQFLAFTGQEDVAIVEAERARQLEPLSAVFAAGIPWYHYWARRYDDAPFASRTTFRTALSNGAIVHRAVPGGARALGRCPS
jgi:tetratricopeptide (TPR) repeat protein